MEAGISLENHSGHWVERVRAETNLNGIAVEGGAVVNSISASFYARGIDILNGNAIGNITISNRVVGINVFGPGTIIGQYVDF